VAHALLVGADAKQRGPDALRAAGGGGKVTGSEAGYEGGPAAAALEYVRDRVGVPRDLPPGAQVTRFGPSPTGYLHIGGVYVAMIDADLARQSGGRYLLRIEDTDQARVTEGAVDQFADGLTYFTISPTEDDLSGRYGPYVQSSRAEIYLTYARELLRQDRAYLDFATKADLEDITAKQRAAGALPGSRRMRRGGGAPTRG